MRSIRELKAIKELYAIVHPYDKPLLDEWIERNLQVLSHRTEISREYLTYFQGEAREIVEHSKKVSALSMGEALLKEGFITTEDWADSYSPNHSLENQVFVIRPSFVERQDDE